MSILPCPSRRVIGLMVKRRRLSWLAALARRLPSLKACWVAVFILLAIGREVHFAAQHAFGEAVSVEGADGVRDARQHLVDVAFFLRRDIGADGGHDLEALVADPRGGAEAAGAGHVAGGALGAATAAGRRSHADDALRQEAELRVRQQLVRALEFGDAEVDGL